MIEIIVRVYEDRRVELRVKEPGCSRAHLVDPLDLEEILIDFFSDGDDEDETDGCHDGCEECDMFKCPYCRGCDQIG